MAEFDQYAKDYESLSTHSISKFFEEKEYFTRYKIEYALNLLKTRNIKTLLDFGCGIGLSLTLFQEHCKQTQLWGYDPSAVSVEIAKQKTGINTIISDLSLLPRHHFDVIFIANVFHHIPVAERAKVMELCKNLLQEEGRCVIFEHNPFNPLTRYVFNRCELDKNAFMLYKKSFSRLAKVNSLQIKHSAYTLFFPRFLSRLRWLEKYMGWLPLGAQYCVEITR